MKQQIMSASNVEKLVTLLQTKANITGTAYSDALNDLNRLRAACENIVHYHNMSDPIMELEAITEMELLL